MTSAATVNVTCDVGDLMARYVTVQKRDNAEVLTLCEAEVYGGRIIGRQISLPDVKDLDLHMSDFATEYQCPPGWSTYNGSCYKLSTSPATFYDAQQHCSVRGAELAVVTTAEEMNFIYSLTT